MNKRRAFTLIELLVVVGIIAALAAMFTVGINALSRKGADDNTRVLLQNCRAMIGELRASVGNNRPLPVPQPDGGGVVWEWPPSTRITVAQLNSSTSGWDFWNIGYGSRTSPRALPAPTGIHSADLTLLPAIRNTHRAMQLLGRCPNNRSGLNQLPTANPVIIENNRRRLLRKDAGSGVNLLQDLTPTGTPSSDPLFLATDVPILLDSWNNPIMFVPAAGLGPVKFRSDDGKSDWYVRSSGVYRAGDPALGKIGPNDRPFFASAGADGSFGASQDFTPGKGAMAADDNLYSFQE